MAKGVFWQALKDSVNNGWNRIKNFVNSFTTKISGSGLTGAEKEANEFTAQQAQINRDWETEMSNTAFQRQVADMQAAGVNPALMYGSGASGASVPSGSAGNSVSPNSGMSFSDLISLLTLKPTIEQLKSSSQLNRDQGKAAIINAEANAQNAETNTGNLRVNERQASVAEFRAETDRMRQEIEAWMAKSDIEVNDSRIQQLAADTAQIKMFTSQLPERLKIMQQQADAQTRQALASLQSSLAAVRQAAVAEKLSDSEIALRESQAYVNWANGDGQYIVNEYMPEHQRAEIKELGSRSGYLDSGAKNLDRNAKVQWMQTITGYTNAACNIANTVFNGFNTFSGIGSRNPIGFK